MDNLTHL